MATVCNSESSVGRIGFFGPDYRYIYCNTHIESFYAWDAVQVRIVPVSNTLARRFIHFTFGGGYYGYNGAKDQILDRV